MLVKIPSRQVIEMDTCKIFPKQWKNRLYSVYKQINISTQYCTSNHIISLLCLYPFQIPQHNAPIIVMLWPNTGHLIYMYSMCMGNRSHANDSFCLGMGCFLLFFLNLSQIPCIWATSSVLIYYTFCELFAKLKWYYEEKYGSDWNSFCSFVKLP